MSVHHHARQPRVLRAADRRGILCGAAGRKAAVPARRDRQVGPGEHGHRGRHGLRIRQFRNRRGGGRVGRRGVSKTIWLAWFGPRAGREVLRRVGRCIVRILVPGEARTAGRVPHCHPQRDQVGPVRHRVGSGTGAYAVGPGGGSRL